MKVPEKLTKTELLILILTVVFLLCTGVMFVLRLQAANGKIYDISTDVIQQEWQDELYAEKVNAVKEVPEPTAENPLDINTATAEELILLPSIGPVLAERIIGYREENGSFKDKKEIMDVKGIGKGIYAEIEERIRVEESAA